MNENTFCKHCGAKINSFDLYCWSCGKDAIAVATKSISSDDSIKTKICKHCGAEMSPKSFFCFNCHRYEDEPIYKAKPPAAGQVVMSNTSAEYPNEGWVVYSNISNASTAWHDSNHATQTGHGWAAEKMNHMHDKFHGKNAEFVGSDNAKNGADRIVDGVNVQTKFCKTGTKSVAECFEHGKFRYWNTDGSPMQVEVPKGQYQEAIQALENRIRLGQVEGITDPNEAQNILRESPFTYQQAKNVAKAGNVDSLRYDAGNGLIIGAHAAGISFIITFAVSMWREKKLTAAAKNAVLQGIQAGGIAWVSAVISGQLSKTGIANATRVVNASDKIIKLIGPKGAAVLANAFRSGKNIYGAAAMKNVSKLLRNNALTGLVSFAVLSSFDVANIFRGRISGKQLFKNMAQTGASIAGGTAGFVAGAKAGALIGTAAIPIPGVGTVIGLASGLIAGWVASKVVKKTLDQFMEDDAVAMEKILNEVFTQLTEDYLVSKEEATKLAEELGKKVTGKILKDMFAAPNREYFADYLMRENFDKMAAARPRITLPSDDDINNALRVVLDEVSDELAIAN